MRRRQRAGRESILVTPPILTATSAGLALPRVLHLKHVPAKSTMFKLAHCFPPLAAADAHTLILGSMPGQASLQAQRYYAHPRNAFWPILRNVLDVPVDADYATASAALVARGFALWDVLAQCERRGSLDADIRAASIEANDFLRFLSVHPGIVRLCFNGATAHTLYRRHVLPTLPATLVRIEQLRLPSTSPAHAGMPHAEKSRLWAEALLRTRIDTR